MAQNKNLNSDQNQNSNPSQKVDLKALAKQVVDMKMNKEQFREFVDQLNLKPMEIEDLKDLVEKLDYQVWLSITGEDDIDPYEEYKFEEDYYDYPDYGGYDDEEDEDEEDDE